MSIERDYYRWLIGSLYIVSGYPIRASRQGVFADFSSIFKDTHINILSISATATWFFSEISSSLKLPISGFDGFNICVN